MTSFSNALVAVNDTYDLELLLMLIQQIDPPHQQFTALAASPALSPLPVVGRQQEIGPRPHRDTAADGFFNISATTFGSPLGRPRPPHPVSHSPGPSPSPGRQPITSRVSAHSSTVDSLGWHCHANKGRVKYSPRAQRRAETHTDRAEDTDRGHGGFVSFSSPRTRPSVTGKSLICSRITFPDM